MQTENSFIKNVVKGVLFSLLFVFALILILAFLAYAFRFSQTCIKWINQFIKVIAIFLACMLSVRESKGAIKGGIIAVISLAIIYLLFVLFGSYEFTPFVLVDFLFVLVVGVISGATAVNAKK